MARRDASSGQTRRRHLSGQLSAPLRRFVNTESGSARLLLAAAVLGLLWANSPWSGAYESVWSTNASIRVGGAAVAMDLGHWVNDGLMAVFFFVVGLEVRREFSIGELTDRRRVVLPLVAGIGGMVLPALLYVAAAPSGAAGHGWGAVIGTDTAFLLGALALVGPSSSTQLRVFLLTLTVMDDIVAVTVIGVVYSDAVRAFPLAVASGCLVLLALLSRLRVWRSSPYVVVVVVLWLATVQSGVHASIAGMVAGLLVPAWAPRRQEVEGAATLVRAFRQSPMPSVGYSAQLGLARAISVNERLQTVLHPWGSFVIVPLFALANAGVDLRGGVLGESLHSPVTWAVVLGLVLGKFVGIGLGALGVVRLRLARLPQGVGPGQVAGGAALSGIGFTVSLLIIGLALDTPALRDEATVGVLVSAVLSVALGWLIFRGAAVFHGERTAELPMLLDPPVDVARDHIRGRAHAPLTLVEFADFECPFCARATGVGRELRDHFGDELRYVFRHLPLPDVHPHAELAAVAAEAAGVQGRFWEMHDLLFTHQDELEAEDLVGYAAALGLDVEQFVRALYDERHAKRIREDVTSAEASGARGTPTFFVGSRRHVGPYDSQTLIRELDAIRDSTRLSPGS
ncbi:MAG TPA: Na+/H+ antiporter NhaA [Mycobacteriales bacterium]|nr:Na+/H+ antiporter NhaA [Mycobacteriales bacterium]